MEHTIYVQEDVREVDPVSAIDPLNFHRRIERQWAERIKSLRRMGGQVVFAAKRAINNQSCRFADSGPGQNGPRPATMWSIS